MSNIGQVLVDISQQDRGIRIEQLVLVHEKNILINGIFIILQNALVYNY